MDLMWWPSNDDHVTIEVASRVVSQLSNLSGSDASAVGNELPKHELPVVKEWSIRNYEILKQLEDEEQEAQIKKSSRGPRSGIQIDEATWSIGSNYLRTMI